MTSELRLSINRRSVYGDGQEVSLTPIEFRLMWAFFNDRGVVISSDKLLCEVWGSAYLGAAHLLRVHIARLRKKIGSGHIETRIGFGYIFEG